MSQMFLHIKKIGHAHHENFLKTLNILPRALFDTNHAHTNLKNYDAAKFARRFGFTYVADVCSNNKLTHATFKSVKR